MTEISESIRAIVQEKGISNDLIERVIEEFLKAAYKKTFGTDENAVVKTNLDDGKVDIFSDKVVVDEDDFYDPVAEIVLEEARNFNPACNLGDHLLIPVDPKEFDRQAVSNAKQRAKAFLRDIQKDTLYSEFQDKVNEVIIGYYQRERNGVIYVDLGKTEGIMPKKNQSPREVYRPGDRIKSMIQEIRKTPTGLQIVLTRRDPEFVKRIFELEVPEISDGIITIEKIVREAGYRTKIAVRSNKQDVDPIGACVGLKGVRIQAIMKELEGERIDILRYDPEPRIFIQNALSPAQVLQVIILDEGRKQALAVVPDESQLSLAIGKQGLNVKLANRLVDWNIDVRTQEQFAEMDITQESKAAAHRFFGVDQEEEEGDDGVITQVAELEGISERLVDILAQNGISMIEDLVSLSKEELGRIEGISPADVASLSQIISENVEFVDEQGEAVAQEEEEGVEYAEEYECPECHNPITLDMTVCPNCGVGLSFEIEEEVSEE